MHTSLERVDLAVSRLAPYFQSRWVCPLHGFFDVRQSRRPAESFTANCPSCQKPSMKRAGTECTGRTSGPVPHITKPRMEEVPEVEFVTSTKAPVRKQGKRW